LAAGLGLGSSDAAFVSFVSFGFVAGFFGGGSFFFFDGFFGASSSLSTNSSSDSDSEGSGTMSKSPSVSVFLEGAGEDFVCATGFDLGCGALLLDAASFFFG